MAYKFEPGNLKKIEGIVDKAFCAQYGDGLNNTLIHLRDHEPRYMLVDMSARVDCGERVRIYTHGGEVGESGNVRVSALEILSETGDVKFTYIRNAMANLGFKEGESK